MDPVMFWVARAVARRGRSVWAATVLLAAVTMAAGLPVAPAANAEDLDCAGDLGDPVSGTPEWQEADLNNLMCAAEGQNVTLNNPALAAAQAANAAAGEGHFGSDPFRAPHRWAGQRGSYELTAFTFIDQVGIPSWPVALFGPLDPDGGPYPGVLWVCHACSPFLTIEQVSIWYWAAQALAEAGYVVMYATVGGNSLTRTIGATDFFLATPEAPTQFGDFNPWHARLDRSRLAIVGHSGGAGVALRVGHTDLRFDAIVSMDPAGGSPLAGVTPRIPTMIQVADYGQTVGPPRPEKPIPAPGSKYTFFDTIRAAGVDAMQVAIRASTHLDWTRITATGATRPHSIYGEMLATYYALAWLDRYLAPPRIPGAPPGQVLPGVASPEADAALSELVAVDALRRLTATGTGRFDRSADAYSIGTGFFDPKKAEKAESDEAGNLPIEIQGIPVRNLLSFQYDSRYYLDGGAETCEDMRAGCP